MTDLLGFVGGVVPTVLVIGLVIGLVLRSLRRGARRPTAQTGEGHGVRRFFQYTLLYGLLWVAGAGVAGLLGRLFDLGRTTMQGPGELALFTAFTVVGAPLYAVVAVWTRRRFVADPRERRSLGWRLYFLAATLSTLGMTLAALHQVLSWIVGLTSYDGGAFGSLIVWGGLWLGHWWVDRRLTPADDAVVHRVLAAVLGLVLVAAGAGSVLADSFRELLGLGNESVFAGGPDIFLPGAVTLAVGLPVWLLYWVVPAARYRRGTLWLAYVLLAGVAGGLVTAIASASLVLYDVLVWLVGDPGTTSADEHFRALPGALAAVAVGGVVWWYHRAVLQTGGGEERTEVRRVYEYLMAGIGLVSGAAGLMMMIVSILQAAAGTGDVITGGTSALNTVLAAATVLVVGGPVWWVFWRRIERSARADAAEEHASPTRRIYVFVLFGVAGIAAVVALLVGVFVVLQDVFAGTVRGETLRSLGYPAGILVASGLLSAYHWAVYRGDRAYVRDLQRGPRYVLLIGPRDPEVATALARVTRGHVDLWPRTDAEDDDPWSLEELGERLLTSTAREVVVIVGPGGVSIVPVDRD